MAKKNAKDNTIINVDEVYTKTEKFVDKNRKLLTLVLGGAVLIILSFMGYRLLVLLPAEKKAEEATFQAEDYFAIGSLDSAQYGDGVSAGLEEIMKDYSGTYAASRAAFQVGVINRNARKFEEAIQAFDKVDLDDDVIGPMSLAGMGDCYSDLKDYAHAAEYFLKAADAADAGLAGKVLSPSYHYKRAITLIELGRTKEAKDVLSHIVSEHPNPDSPEYQTAVALGESL